ncbi:hypothetical protein BDK92_5952 [Micromonospora pisi]|uniref:Lipoprotein n=1 Tax=Micromonospora pisi TaxID=589240 RepID=A0A495JT48_9ACTN|nr:hypothetical protein [Micromonospora pisi]RKR91552.1 hypothetical protein BDK92_5952 [Micromonospora pisi]
MRYRALAMIAVAVTASAALVACNGDEACAAPGGSSGGRSTGGSSGSKSTGGGTNSNRTAPKAPVVLPAQPAGQVGEPAGQPVQKMPGNGSVGSRTGHRDGGPVVVPYVVGDDDNDDCD